MLRNLKHEEDHEPGSVVGKGPLNRDRLEQMELGPRPVRKSGAKALDASHSG
jgi:hypothetical protein